MNEPLVQEFIDFLRSFKNSETLSTELRKAISVDTSIQKLVIDACRDKQSILLTGSAGSGKTHLLQAVITELQGKFKIIDKPTRSTQAHVLVIQDATELSVHERIQALTHKSDNCVAKIMAINEGPLRETSKEKDGELFRQAIQLLHKGHRGISESYDAHKPVVIDMQAYDPLEAGVVADLLNLPILSTAIETVSADPESPRRRAWNLLKSPLARQRIAAVLKLAKLARPEWLFRDVWDFVADIALGGSDFESTPSSPWFWRLFFGDSLISRAIQQVADPSLYSLPTVEARLWYGDWNSDVLRLIDGLKVLPISNPSEQQDAYLWVKTQCLLLLDSYKFDQAVLVSSDEQLVSAIERGDTSALIRRFNEYVTYGLGEASETSLSLWTDHRIERRTSSHQGLIQLGTSPTRAFSIQKSLVVMNHPRPPNEPLRGNRAFLIHNDTNAVFSLDRRRLSVLEQARSLRIADRDHVEFVWDLYRFFDTVLSGRANETQFSVSQADVENGSFVEKRYEVSITPPKIELRP